MLNGLSGDWVIYKFFIYSYLRIKKQRRKKKQKNELQLFRFGGEMMIAEGGKEQVGFPREQNWPPHCVACNICTLGHLVGSQAQEFLIARKLQSLAGDCVKPICGSKRYAKALQNQNIDGTLQNEKGEVQGRGKENVISHGIRANRGRIIFLK